MAARRKIALGDEVLERLVETAELAARDAVLLEALLEAPSIQAASIWREVELQGEPTLTRTLTRGDETQLPTASQVEAVTGGQLASDFLAGVHFIPGSSSGKRACLVLSHGSLEEDAGQALVDRAEALFVLSNQLAIESSEDSVEFIQSLLRGLDDDPRAEENTPG